MTLTPIIHAATVRQAASGRWWWSCCRPGCAEYHSGYLSEHTARRDAYKHERKH